ncbi:hypothetical protein [Hymenobacter volaticus]|uniref:Uncharacterized protein n=1 Tax=Hymenobacter volaticus TaxID=2932254 RepID=A0ABY4G2H6_9BACT|nr:hypothetical protein [Hymenobacter volaticus]UOQ64864.1 hypothetical protein MUN86_14975 [Hymenobacter volaticus]
MAPKRTFKSIVPTTFAYSRGKLWEGFSYPLYRMNLNKIIEFVNETKQELINRFGSVHDRSGVGAEIDSIEFILERLSNWHSANEQVDIRDQYVYLEALESHFEHLFEMFDEMDSE